MNQDEVIKTGMQYRHFEIDTRKIDADKRRVPLSFSSDTPVKRYFGFETLDHGRDAVDLSFLGSGRAPLLKDHDRNAQVGVVESASISGGKGRAVARFGKSRLADEEFSEVKDGIRLNVSVGYQIEEMALERQDDDGDHYRVTRWRPLEISIVSIPADDSVGVGRGNEKTFNTKIINERTLNIMDPDTNKNNNGNDNRNENNRAKSIITIGNAHNMLEMAAEAVQNGTSAERFNQMVLDRLRERGLTPVEDPSPIIGMTPRETRQYSIVKLIRALAEPGNARLQDEAGLEFEASRAVADKMKRAPRGVFLPWDALAYSQRDLNTTDDSALIGTNLVPGSFIDVLRNKMVVREAGARILDGLVGNLAIPKKTASASVYWVADDLTGPTESEATFGTVSLSPKRVGTFTDMTRGMLLQATPAIEELVRSDLAGAIGVALDAAALHGSGSSNQPTGIASTSGIGSVAGGTNGAAPDWDDIVDLESEVAVDNADVGRLGYITNAKVRGKLKKTLITATYGDKHVWNNDNADKPLNGYRAFVTNQVASNLDKGTSTGVCSAIFFGNWEELIIGMWSGIDILVDPYTHSKAGGLRISALADVDISVRHAESFAAMLDALTA